MMQKSQNKRNLNLTKFNSPCLFRNDHTSIASCTRESILSLYRSLALTRIDYALWTNEFSICNHRCSLQLKYSRDKCLLRVDSFVVECTFEWNQVQVVFQDCTMHYCIFLICTFIYKLLRADYSGNVHIE